MSVRLRVEGSASELTPATGVAAYRVMQEALTNVIRHAPGASVEVYVRYAANRVQIEVIDNGRANNGGSLPRSPGTGHGLIGLRERAVALGGTIETGPLSPGGFRVCVCLPAGASQ